MNRLPILLISFLVATAGPPPARAQNSETAELLAQEQQRRKTAVTLNYCRAAFHRIRKNPSRRVLVEEREKILNNLNLNGIADEEAMNLYSAVLAEISDVQIAEEEQKFIRDNFRKELTHTIAGNAFEFGLSLAGGQYLDAVRTGAGSWWDYRSLRWNRDVDDWKVEKGRMQAVVDKSTLFLDTFWKLAHKRNIPDRWLVRGSDLDRLETTLLEPDPEVRLRVLKRMEPFMEFYPPYLYYTARTQQANGQLTAAADTYQRLAELGDGQFRKDSMLAAGMANLAAIQAYQRHPAAVRTAQAALRYATDEWQVNLMCAQILKDHLRYEDAEDAILRNLDVNLERRASTNRLVGLYVESNNSEKLAEVLNEENNLNLVATPLLVQAAAVLDADQIPGPLLARLESSFYGYFDGRFGRQDLVFIASPAWQLHNARLSLHSGNRTLAQAEVRPQRDHYQVRFRRRGNEPVLAAQQPITLSIRYPHARNVRLRIAAGSAPAPQARPPLFAGRFSIRRTAGSVGPPSRPSMLRVTSIEVGQTSLALDIRRPLRPPEAADDTETLVTPTIPVSAEAEASDVPVITPTFVLPEFSAEDAPADGDADVTIFEVQIDEPADGDAEEVDFLPPPDESS